jgi:hypothetical protein
MPSRRVRAVLRSVSPTLVQGLPALRLGFELVPGRGLPDRIEDLAALGPELDLASVRGVGKVLRLLRAARLAVPDDPRRLLGRVHATCVRLERALGTPVMLHLRSRVRVRFRAWTETGVEEVENVAEVVEETDAYWVRRHGGLLPVRLPRNQIVRTLTERETWFEVLHIERADPPQRTWT